MRRRAFITLLGGAAAAWPLGARAQETGKVARIGFLGPSIFNDPSSMFIPLYQALLAQLRVLGFNEGQNLVVTYGAVDDARGLPAVAAELTRSQPELIVVSGTEAMLQSVLAANRAIPIVLIAVNFDPIARGYVTSLARPGGNITGVVFQQLELAEKQVELLTQTFPGKTRLAALYDAQTADQFSAAERSAKSLKLQIQGRKLENPPYDFDAAFRNVVADGAQMVLVQSSPLFIPHQARIANWQECIVCLPCSCTGHTSTMAVSCPTASTSQSCIAALPITLPGYSEVPSPPIYRWSKRRSSSL
jgi:putative ABC transport system substrate-binding protein